MIIFHRHLTDQLVKYQLFVTQLATNYNVSAWYSYDQAFRLFICNNPGTRWDQCNEDIYNVHIRGAQGGSRCFSCGGRDHYASACPVKRRSGHVHTGNMSANLGPSRSAVRSLPSNSFSANSFSSNAPFLGPQLARSASQSIEICRNFNFRACSQPSCQRIHRCLKCNQSHPAMSVLLTNVNLPSLSAIPVPPSVSSAFSIGSKPFYL